MAKDPMINPKPISPFHTFKYPKGQMGSTSLGILQDKNINHHCKWKNVYFNNIPKTQF